MALPKRMVLLAALLLFACMQATAQQKRMENLGRGVVATRVSSSQAQVSWRMLGTDPDTIGFNLYRSVGGGTPVKVNGSPLTTTTDFRDTPGDAGFQAGVSYFVRPVLGGVEQAPSRSFSLPSGVATQPFFSVPIERPQGGTTPTGETFTYAVNDASPADLDGDGELDLVIKWDPSNGKDNSQGGYTGPVLIDGYRLDGTRLWRINLGINIRAGAHYTQFMAYDLDSDGRAEVAMKTAPGTIDGTGAFVLLAGDDPATDYRNSSGYILTGPEYLTIFDGQTGRALATTSYNPPRGTVSSWGDSYGNRVDRFLACVAYLDGERPSLVMARGYYTKTYLVAWDWRDRTLSQRWVFFADNNTSYAGQGNHNLSVADVDADGRQEIVYGAMTVDDNGTGLYTTRLGHGDAMHVSDFDPNRPGLEVFSIFESSASNGNVGAALRDAATGAILWHSTANFDVGRGVAMDIDPRYPGSEAWSSADGNIYSAAGQVIAAQPSNMFRNFGVWWDADPLREQLDGTTIAKWNHTTSGRSNIITAWQYGAASINGTKATPSLSGDILGDWREEVVWPNTDNTALLVFVTPTQAWNRLRTFLHDPQYRVSLAWQNVAYNQPPHPSFFVGQDMAPPPLPDIRTDPIPLPRLPSDVRWNGSQSNSWDLATANFTDTATSTPVPFIAGDRVLVDDTAVSPISIAENVSPGSVSVHRNQALTLGGAGAIGGNATLSKSGTGTLTLSTVNTFTGGTTITAGTVAIGHAGALGTGSVTLRGGTLAMGALAPQNALVIDGTGTVTGGASGGQHGIRSITGSGDLSAIASSVFDFEGSLSGFNGRVLLSGVGSFRFFGSAGSASAEWDLGTRTVSARSGTAFALGGLSGQSGSVLSGSSGSGNTAAVTYTIGARGGDTEFRGAITNGANTTSVVKTGTGRITLGGTNTYSGNTTVSQGTLVVTGSLGTSAVAVSANAVLGGPGSLGGSVTLAKDAGLAIGFEPSRARGPAVTGNVTLGETLRVTALALGATPTPGTYTLISSGAALSGAPAFSWTAPAEAPYLTASFSTATPGSVLVTLVDPRTLLQKWTEERFGLSAPPTVSAPDADPDGDGDANLLEYALGGDPLLPATHPGRPVAENPGGRMTLAFQRIADPALVYEVQAADSPAGPWTSIWTSTGASNTAGAVVVQDVPEATGRAGRFMRLVVR